MIMKLLRISFIVFIIFCLFSAYKYYNRVQEQKKRDAYIANIVDTSTPTVSVLRDSIYIEYQNEKRTIHVYVPPNYATDTTERYPVMYFMDGESSFNDMENMSPEWEIDEVINAAAKAGKQTAIVIGIEQSDERDDEYTPFVIKDIPNAHGTEYAEWVATDLKKWVDSNYRTKTEAKATSIGGISRSGMMAYFMLMKHPDVFGNALIQSPSMWVDYDRLFAMEISDEDLEDKKIFVSVGEYEGNEMISLAEDVYDKFMARGLDDNHIHYELIADEAHWHMTWRKSFAKAYPWIMNNGQ